MMLNSLSLREKPLNPTLIRSGHLVEFARRFGSLNLRGGTGVVQEDARADQSSSSGLQFGFGKFCSIESSDAESWNAAIERDNAAMAKEKAAAYAFALPPEHPEGAFDGARSPRQTLLTTLAPRPYLGPDFTSSGS